MSSGSSVTNSFTPTTSFRRCSISHCCRAAASAMRFWNQPSSRPLHHAAGLVDLLEQRFRFALELVRERLDIVGAAEWVDHVGHARLVGEDLLRAKRHLHRLFRRQRQRFVHAVGVQRLRAAEHRGEALIRHAHDVVHGLLRGERHTGRLRVKAHDP